MFLKKTKKKEIIPDYVQPYFHFLDLNQHYWDNKEYELVNLNRMIKYRGAISNQYYADLTTKIVQNNFRAILSVADLLKEYKIDLDFSIQTNKKEIMTQFKKLPDVLEAKVNDENISIKTADLIMAIQNGKVIDVIDGDLIIVSRSYYQNVSLHKKTEPKLLPKQRREFKKVKLTITLICILIVVILVILAIFSGDIQDVMVAFRNWLSLKIGAQINDQYVAILIAFVEFLIKIALLYIVYRIFLMIIQVAFKIMKKTTIRQEMEKICLTNYTLKDRIEEFTMISRNIAKKTASAVRGLSIFLKVVFFIFVVVIVLSLFNLSFSSLLTSAGILTIAITIGAQTHLGDYFSGMLYAFEDHYNLGDLVKINGITGRVISANLRRICIETYDKQRHFLLHSQIKGVQNYSKDNNMGVVEFDIAYESDPQKVVDLLKKKLAKSWHTNRNIIEAPEVYAITNFNSSGIGFRVIAECEKETSWSVERWLRMQIFYIFKNSNVEIPYQKIVLCSNFDEPIMESMPKSSCVGAEKETKKHQ